MGVKHNPIQRPMEAKLDLFLPKGSRYHLWQPPSKTELGSLRLQAKLENEALCLKSCLVTAPIDKDQLSACQVWHSISTPFVGDPVGDCREDVLRDTLGSGYPMKLSHPLW